MLQWSPPNNTEAVDTAVESHNNNTKAVNAAVSESHNNSNNTETFDAAVESTNNSNNNKYKYKWLQPQQHNTDVVYTVVDFPLQQQQQHRGG